MHQSSSFSFSPVHETSIDAAAHLMLNSFWLEGNNYIGDKDALSSSSRLSLETLQADDMRERYGERMGKRLFDTCLFAAYGADEALLGVVGVEMRLFKKKDTTLIDNGASEQMLKRELTTLGPKQRRLYKDYITPKLVPELLPGMDAIALLCNLSVSPLARRSGIGSKLCRKVEQYVKQSWGFDDVYLKVEKENIPARKLYEGNLEYKLVGEDEAAIALRLNVDDACFEQTQAATLVLKKSI